MTTITDMSNPVYMSEDKDIIALDIMTDEYGLIPTTVILSENDPATHVLQIKEWLSKNPIAPFIPNVETPAQASDRKNSQVEAELGTDAVRIIIETILPYIDAGLNPADIINEAKAKRRNEL